MRQPLKYQCQNDLQKCPVENIPHMSITRLEEYQEADEAKKLLQIKTMKFTVQELLLTNLGDDGTCNEIYARFQLQA